MKLRNRPTLLFVGPISSPLNEQDGMVQRVAAIDAVFESFPRTIIEVSFRRNLSLRPRTEHRGNLTVIWCNFFLHFYYLLILSFSARLVYMHSVYSAAR